MFPAATSSATALATFVVDPNNAITANALQKVAQINQVFDPVTTLVVTSRQIVLSTLSRARFSPPPSTLHNANANRVRQAEQLLIHLQAKQGTIYY